MFSAVCLGASISVPSMGSVVAQESAESQSLRPEVAQIEQQPKSTELGRRNVKAKTPRKSDTGRPAGGKKRDPALTRDRGIPSRAVVSPQIAPAAKQISDAVAREPPKRDVTATPENIETITDDKLASIARSYCSNNLASAAEARIASKRKALLELEERIEKKSAELSRLTADARDWVDRREKGRAMSRDSLVDAYSKMRPEAAAQQIGAMSDDVAVSIIMKLNARAASAIMNEMGADRAARIADKALRKPGDADDRQKSGS